MKKLNWLVNLSQEEARATGARFWGQLVRDALPISLGASRIPISLEPFALSASQYKNLQKQAVMLMAAARKLVEAYFIDPILQEVLAINEAERIIVESAQNEPLEGVVRFDLLYGDGPQVVEINADFPDGLFILDVTARTIAKLAHAPNPTLNSGLFVELLQSKKIPLDAAIYVGYDRGRKFIDEFEICKIALKNAGRKRIFAGPMEDLMFKDGACYFQNTRIQVLRRGMELSKLRKNSQLLRALVEAQARGLHIINNFKMRLLGHKALLAALHDTRFARYLTAEELHAVEEMVPKTYKLDSCEFPAILKNKNGWVLKPSDLTEGSGVVVGSSASQAQWEQALDEALQTASQWVVQKKVTLPEETFGLLDETGALTQQRAYYDLDPHIFLFADKNVLGNILVRFSNAEIVNVMQGGGVTYAYCDNEN